MTAAEMEVEPPPPTGAAEAEESAPSSSSSVSSPTSAVTNVYAKDKDKADNSPTTTNDKNTAVTFSPELLQMYYSRLFPFELLHAWLAYDPTHNTKQNGWIFSRREFSMTLEVNPGDEIYMRYQSFANQDELVKAILKRRPIKIDLGAIFTAPPKDHKTLQKSELQPVQRELVFDIDMDDYDPIRHCGCSGPQICPKCWVFMQMAVEVLESGLCQDFGFEHVAWFYSGRRGIHCWVCDESARTLPNEARNAVASYFEVEMVTANKKDVHLHVPVHPSLRRSFEILEPWFISEILPASGHGLLASEERWQKDLLDTIPEAGKTVASVLARKWKEDTSSTPAQKWEQLKRHIKVLIGKSNDGSKAPKSAKTLDVKAKELLEHWPMEVVFCHTYPRLDINVTKTMNHLLKSPFCVHPKTGRVCVPIQAKKIRQFDPFAVPTLNQLMEELDQYQAEMQDDDDDDKDSPTCNNNKRTPKHDWQKTSLLDYFQPFQQSFLEPLQKEIRLKEKQQAEEESAMRGEF